MNLVGILLCSWALTLVVGSTGETITLDELLASHSTHPELSRPIQPLKLAWVGDVIDEDGTVTKLRLDHGGIPDPGNGPMLVRMRGQSYLWNESPCFREHLPGLEDLQKLKSLAAVETLLGDPGPVIDGWHDGGRICWNPDWVHFTREAADRLVYLRVSASVSRVWGENKDAPARVDRISIAKGILRPANPNSKAEFMEYPTGESLFLAEQEMKKRKREQLPEPLRRLVAIREHPDDSDLAHWRAYLNAVRKAPDPMLFQQLIHVLDEGTCEMRSNFEDILLDGWLKLEPWKTEQRSVAVEACINAIPTAKNDSIVEHVVITLLKMNGGGSIEVQSLDGTSGRAIKVSGNGYSLGGAKNPLPIPEVQRSLRELLIGKRH